MNSTSSTTDLIFVGSYNKVCAINPKNGAVLWENTFDKSFFKVGSGIVNIGLHSGFLIASCWGKIYCLDLKTGETLWTTKISGVSGNLTTFTFASASSNNNLVVSAREAEWKAD